MRSVKQWLKQLQWKILPKVSANYRRFIGRAGARRICGWARGGGA